MRRIRRSFIVVCVALAASLILFGSPASAALDAMEAVESTDVMVTPSSTTTVTAVVADPTCEDARAKTGEAGQCAAQANGGASVATIATAAQLKADGSLVSPDGMTLSEAAAAGYTIWTRTWWQETRGLYYINWWEKHSGRIYYHSGHVWSTTSNHGYTGWHVCDQGGGIGYDIRVTSCFTETRSLNAITEWDYWKVYVFFKGFPLSASHNMHANAYGSGSIYFHW